MVTHSKILPLTFMPRRSLHVPPYFESNSSLVVLHTSGSFGEQGLCSVCLYSSARHSKYLHQLKASAVKQRGRRKGRITPKSFLCVCRQVQVLAKMWNYLAYPLTAGGV